MRGRQAAPALLVLVAASVTVLVIGPPHDRVPALIVLVVAAGFLARAALR
jgi:hypothetical protein